MIKNAIYSIVTAGAVLGLYSCEKNDSGNGQGVVTPQAQAALFDKYPSATDVRWKIKNGYSIAEFNSSSQTGAAAWFDNSGKWYMTETDIPFSALPEAVKTAFSGSEYAAWQVDDIDLLERESTETIYVIEIEGENEGTDSEIDLYYSSDGILVKKIADAASDYDYSDYIPAQPTAGAEDYIRTNYPNARILDIDREGDMTEIELLDETTCRELLFNTSGNWLYTKTEIRRSEVPTLVLQALSSSEYAGYRIDDIDYYQTSTKNYYRFDLESAAGDVKVDITPEGSLSIVAPGDGNFGNSENNSSLLDKQVTQFISQKYPGANVLEYDYDDGLLEVEIFHESREKSVYFNGADIWVKTEWDIRYNELPETVSAAIRNSQYGSYRIDDIEFIQNPNREFYRIELEGGNQEIKLNIDTQGRID